MKILYYKSLKKYKIKNKYKANKYKFKVYWGTKMKYQNIHNN